MINVYVFPCINGISHIPLLNPLWGVPKKAGSLFVDEAFSHYTDLPFTVVSQIDKADYTLFPHNYFHLKQRGKLDLMYGAARESAQAGKPIIIYAPGDSDEDILFSNAVILRYSQYRYKLKSNEIIIPVFSGDFLGEATTYREKRSEIPAVGFCGWTAYRNLFEALKNFIKNVYYSWQAFWGNKNAELHKKGIYFRRIALKYLQQSPNVRTNIIIRSSHSAHKETIQGDAESLRREYIQNMLDSDLCLTVKGDGNISLRFYEALALGRIPIFVDTGCILPLEEVINYKDFILYIHHEDLPKIASIAHDYFASLDPEIFVAKQKLARSAFVRYLRSDAFFKYIFSDSAYLKRYTPHNL